MFSSYKLKAFLFYPLLSGILFWLAWPPLPFTFFIFFAFVPVLIAEKIISEKFTRAVTLKCWLSAYTAFIIWNALTTWWVCNATFSGGFFAILFNAGLMTVPFLVSRYVKKHAGELIGYFSLIVFWMSFEYIHLRWEFAWPWLNLGNVFALNNKWVQWYAYTGQFGGTLWVLVVNMLIFYVIRDRYFNKNAEQKIMPVRKMMMRYVLILLLIICPILLSLRMYYNYSDKGKPENVTVVQPNIDPYTEKFVLPVSTQMKKIISLSREKVNDSTDYLVWPETAIPDDYVWLNNLRYQKPIRTLKSFTDSFPKLTTITGISGALRYTDKSQLTVTSREVVSEKDPFGRQDTIWFDFFNTAIQVDTSKNIPYYNKSKLVPGVERMPYPGTLKFLNYFVIDLGGISGSLGTQKERTVFFNHDSIGVAPVICYESIFGEYITRYVKNGANLIFIITNDGWWGNTAGHTQHCLYATLRCIETRRSIARSANTGTSCFINQRGDISDATAWDQDAVINQTIYANDAMTFYVLNGDYLARAAVWISGFLLVFSFVNKIRRKKAAR